jgi:hypothetical protein
MGCFPSPSLFLQWAILTDTSPKKRKIGKLPLNSSLHVMIKCLSFWLSYLGEDGRTLGKGYGKKVSCSWENPWGTHGNRLGTKKIYIFHPHNRFLWEFFIPRKNCQIGSCDGSLVPSRIVSLDFKN